ncbi:hypothetical protein GUI04_08005, partial [Xanthomonas citri pv. citri]|nr:hypothetical protein [Xanthomonas citri pv. citri]
FNYRLYNFNQTNRPDPAIHQSFVHHLRTLCPEGGDGARRVGLDTGSVHNFDISYYENLRKGQGFLESDSKLWSDRRTRRFVERFFEGKRSQESKF